MTYTEQYGELSNEWGGCQTEALSTESKILNTSNALVNLLLYKNHKYGDTALNPLNVMSKSPALEKLLIRADDKISRIKNSDVLRKNDVVDLMGYLILICVERGWNDFKDQMD